MDEPLGLDAARSLIRQIVVARGRIAFPSLLSGHANQRAGEKKVTSVEIFNVLKAGAVVGLDLIQGTWRYQVEANNLRVVVAFDAEDEADIGIRVVTTLRID